MALKLINQATGKEADTEPRYATLSNIARAQFEEWQTHAPTKDLKNAEGGIVYLRLGDLRDETAIDSRGEPVNLVRGEADKGSDTQDVSSITDVGLLNPPRVAHDKMGWYTVAGRRRVQFMLSVFDPSTIVMCTLQAGTKTDQMIASLVENAGRQGLSVAALAIFMHKVEKETKMERKMLAERSGFSPQHVSNLLNVAGYLTEDERTKWRANPKAIDLKSAISRIAQAAEEGKKNGKPPARVNLFEGGAASETSPEDKAKKKRANKVHSMITDYGDPNHVIGLEKRVLDEKEQLDLIMRGYRLAMGEDVGIVLERLASTGDMVASIKSTSPTNGESKPAAEVTK